MEMSTLDALITIAGMAAITVISRGFFALSQRELVLPGWIKRGLRYAPLAALSAVIAPEILMTQGELISTWRDARLFAVAAGSLYFWWRRGILGTILTGMAVFLPLRIALGW